MQGSGFGGCDECSVVEGHMAHVRQSRLDLGRGFQVQGREFKSLFFSKLFSLRSEAVTVLSTFEPGWGSWLVFEAHRLLYHSALGLGVIKKERRWGS